MAQFTAKITKLGEPKEYNGKNGTVYYYDIEFDNGAQKNIGVKSKDKLAIGKEITYDEKEDNKITIAQSFAAKAMGSYSDKTGMMVGASINCATTLFAHGKIEKTQFEATAEWLCNLSIKLKEQFKDK